MIMPFFEVDKNNESIQAICFSHGTLKDQDKGNLKLKCFRQRKQTNSKSDETDRYIVRADINSMSYIGTNYGDANRFPVDTCDYYISVYNKKNNKVRVIPANILQLDPWLEDKPRTDEVDAADSTFREKKDALTREFGSGRNQRAVNKRLKNALDDEMISATTKAIVKVSAPQIEADEPATPSKNEMSTIPPFDIDAQIPEDVYKLKDIIPPEILPSLTQHSEVFYNCKQSDVNQWRTEKKYFTTVLDYLDRLSEREEPRLLQCQCLLYLQYLMETFLMKAIKLRVKYPLPSDWPIPVKDHILKMFTLEIKEPSKPIKRCVPSRMKDLLLSYIIVLVSPEKIVCTCHYFRLYN
ncbi:hypothetical protein Btru_003137 [Bulinus truncatus]|nr:hypothetical protein Btru_003137 [Bulinus truncatus]